METGDRAIIKMKEALAVDMIVNPMAYKAKVLDLDEEKENISFQIEKKDLASIAQDAIYEVTIETGTNNEVYLGNVVERFNDKKGSIINFHIKNGVYIR
ncbi:MAG: hypothetical protein LBM02_02945 [Lachnospiraceae bacterium]|nr:hypothetical protein [Lachnospiraceae bacterium]